MIYTVRNETASNYFKDKHKSRPLWEDFPLSIKELLQYSLTKNEEIHNTVTT